MQLLFHAVYSAWNYILTGINISVSCQQLTIPLLVPHMHSYFVTFWIYIEKRNNSMKKLNILEAALLYLILFSSYVYIT